MEASSKFFDDNNNIINEKKCLRCLNIKPLEDFNKSKNGKYGYHNFCRECISKYNKEDYENNKDIKKRKVEIYNLDNYEEVKEQKRRWYYKKIGKEMPSKKEQENPLDDLPAIDSNLNF